MTRWRTWLGPSFAVLALAGCGGAPTPASGPADPGTDAASPGTDLAPAGDAPADPPAADAGEPAKPAGDAPAKPAGDAPAEEPAEKPKPSAIDLGGTLSTAQVSKFVEEHQSYFEPCIQIAEKSGPTYKVSITTKVYVGPRGKVNTTEVLKTTSKDKSFGPCVEGAFKKIVFGKPKEGATATLTFPMTFSGEVQ
jgi:hypothetical protein